MKDLYGNVTTAESDIVVNLSSTSKNGYFTTSPPGEPSKTLNVTIPNGQQTATVWYVDYDVGNPVTTASANSLTSTSYTASITPGAVTPASPVTFPKNSAVVNETVGLSVTLQDYLGHTVSGKTVEVTSSRGNVDSITGGPNQFSINSEKTGNLTLRVKDATDNIYLSTVPSLTYTPGPLSVVRLSDFPASQTAGEPLNLTVSLFDHYGNLKNDTRNTISFLSSDSQSVLPSDYTLNPSDHASRKFQNIILKTSGDQTISVTEKTTNVSGQAKITITPTTPSATASYLKSDKTFIKPNGSDKAVISVVVTDEFRNGLANKNTQLFSNRAEDKIETYQAVTNEKGEAYYGITSTK
ncbi:MAG: hypothetical protein NT135_00070, partial [Candidatus Berkelbacteria bacterium]|nr:hypothetical protein [Candidatus Berkelbacteria bacterium]